MIVLLDTSTALCRLTLIEGKRRFDYEWQADRQLARRLHAFIHEQLDNHGFGWNDIDGIGVFKGPGSFTGLRIGLTVLNGVADSLGIPIVGTMGDKWQTEALGRLEKGENDRIVLPEYGSAANITKPRK